MMSRGGAKAASSLFQAAKPRLFSTATTSTIRSLSNETIHLLRPAVADLASPSGMNGWIWTTRAPAIGGVRFASTVTLGEKTTTDANPKKTEKESSSTGGDVGGDKGEKGIASYWGVEPSKITKEDGTEWKWNCFRPWETYKADLTIDLSKHHVPTTFLDKLAYWTVKSLRWPTDLFFQRRYGCRAMMLETVAAVPGMVGGMLLHCKSLRRFEQSGGWIKALLEEAENERMHLMTFMEVAKPKWYERALVITIQGVFFNAYFLGYLISPKFAHRMVGYLEEEAIHSYTEFLKELDKGNIENVPAPAIAIDYWRLPADATLRDVVMVVRADEAHHRDVNHFASDIHYQGRELKEAPAPIGYH
ncbi:hypothetical protein N665_0034s0001 [Sinapis alba]|nr:hypothetical protein N665_0034s0001 [Sinapis alba]